MTTTQRFSAHILIGIAGAIAGAKLWRAHPVIGGILGFMVGGHTAGLVLPGELEIPS